MTWTEVLADEDGGSPITGYKVSWGSGGPLGEVTVPSGETSHTAAASNGGGPITGYRAEYRVTAPAAASTAFTKANIDNLGWAVADTDADTPGIQDFPRDATNGTIGGLVKGYSYEVRICAEAA